MLNADQSSKAMTVLSALRANVEGRSHMDMVEGEFYDVYLDNASAELDMSTYTFRSCLSVLARKAFIRWLMGMHGEPSSGRRNPYRRFGGPVR